MKMMPVAEATSLSFGTPSTQYNVGPDGTIDIPASAASAARSNGFRDLTPAEVKQFGNGSMPDIPGTIGDATGALRAVTADLAAAQASLVAKDTQLAAKDGEIASLSARVAELEGAARKPK